VALAALDDALIELTEAVTAAEAALEVADATELEVLAEALEAAVVAYDAAAAAYETLEPPPALVAEVPAAFHTPEPEPQTLPLATGRDQIVLLVRDPESIFTYWELTAAGVGRTRGEEGGDLVLRIHVLPDDDATPEVHDFLVEDWLGSRTITLNRPGLRVVASVGFRTADRFNHVARAAAVRMPRRSAGTGPVRFTRAGARPERRPLGPRFDPEGEWAQVEAARMAPAPVAAVRADSAAIVAYASERADDPGEAHRIVGSNHLIPSEGRL